MPILEDAHRTDPLDVEIANNLASAYFNTSFTDNDFSKAKAKLVDTLRLKPDRSVAWANLGRAFAMEGNEFAATNCYINFFSFSKDKAKALQSLAKGTNESNPVLSKAMTNAYKYEATTPNPDMKNGNGTKSTDASGRQETTFTNSDNEGSKEASAVITSPREAEEVSRSYIVTGSISDLKGNVRAFLIIQSTAAQFGQRIYPQGEIIPGEDARWTLRGIYASSDYSYRTYVVMTENPGSAQLLIDHESRMKGLEQLPADTRIISTPILVYRK